jgi:lambda family phage portal protein
MTELAKVKSNLVDRAIGYFDPVRAARRYQARNFMALTGAYTGALLGRRVLGSWANIPQDADSAILPDLLTLRERSRDLVRNNPIASGAINTAVTNVVGTGLKLQARPDREVLNLSDEVADRWESTAEREFRMWASKSQFCDIRKTSSFADIQNLIFRQTLENGDVFTVMTREKTSAFPYTLRLQLVEGDRVCNEGFQKDTAVLAGGVERANTGAPIFYHIMDQHPGNWLYQGGYTWTKVPAFGERSGMRNVIHSYRVLRPGQSRGVPYLAPVIETLKQLGRYAEAELMGTVVAALFTVFIKTEFGDPGLGNMALATGADNTATSSEKEVKLGSGALIGLRPGESIETADPKRPNANFDSFIKAILEQVGVSLEIPFEILIGHFSASYSASRAALLEAWRFFRGRRHWLATSFCQEVYENFLFEGVSLGRIVAPGFFSDPLIRNAYCGAIWIGEAPAQIDPRKEVDAAEKRLELCLTTRDEETVAITGGDFESNFPRIKMEKAMLESIGIDFQKKSTLPGQSKGGMDENVPQNP